MEILIDNVNIPLFMLWKWAEKDYEKGLPLTIGDYRAHFFFIENSFLGKKDLGDRQVMLHGKILINIETPEKAFLDGLRNQTSPASLISAKRIYEIYETTIQKVVAYCRWIGKLPSIVDGGGNTSFDDMFGNPGSIMDRTHVSWREASGQFMPFTPIKPKSIRKINPIFKSSNILTRKKWEKIIHYAKSNNLELSEEIEQLLRKKSRVTWNEKRIQTVETAALMEVVIRNAVQKALEKQGHNKKKIEAANDGAGFSSLLNLLLPLILTKKEFRRCRRSIEQLDKLRKIRNEIMHRNTSEKNIDQRAVLEGIEGAIRLAQVLNTKYP